MHNGLSVRKAKIQPYPEMGILYEFDVIKSGDVKVDRLVDLIRWQMQKVGDEDDEDIEMVVDEVDEAEGHLFLFDEKIKSLEEDVGNAIDMRRRKWRDLMQDILNELSHVERYENDALYGKGHPFESLVVIGCLEHVLQEKAKQHDLYAIEPLEKEYGTEYASKYDWADGENVQEAIGFVPNTDYSFRWMSELANIFEEAFDGSSLSDDRNFFEISLTKAHEILNKTKAYLAKDLQPVDWNPLTNEQVKRIVKLQSNRNDICEEDMRIVENYLEHTVEQLKILVGYHQLRDDSKDLQWDAIYKASGICESGYPHWDLEMRNVIYGGLNKNGVPMFTIIDQWIEYGERDYKRRKYGGGGGSISLRMGP